MLPWYVCTERKRVTGFTATLPDCENHVATRDIFTAVVVLRVPDSWEEKPSIFFTCDAFPCGLFRLRRVQSAACFSRDRGSTFVTRASRSHGKCVATNEGVRCAHTKGGQLGPHGALCGANTGVPHHTTSTCQRGCPPHNDTDPHTHTNATTLHMCPLHT